MARIGLGYERITDFPRSSILYFRTHPSQPLEGEFTDTLHPIPQAPRLENYARDPPSSLAPAFIKMATTSSRSCWAAHSSAVLQPHVTGGLFGLAPVFKIKSTMPACPSIAANRSAVAPSAPTAGALTSSVRSRRHAPHVAVEVAGDVLRPVLG